MLLFRQLAPLAVLWALAIALAPIGAAEHGESVLTVKQASVGFGGKFKAGFWQPLRISVVAGSEGARGRLEVVAADGDQSPVVYRDSKRGELSLKPHEERSLLLYAKSGPTTAGFRLRLVDGESDVWSQELAPLPPALRSTQELVVGIGPPLELSAAVATIRRRAEGGVEAAQTQTADELPDCWWGYEGVDVVVLTTSDLDRLAALDGERQRALVEWVLLGGRIVLCVGRNGEAIAQAAGRWAPLIPGELVDVAPLRERSGLERFTKSELPFEDAGFQRNRPYVTRLRGARGEVLLDEANGSSGRPLVIHAPAGLGQVTFVGLDLDHPSLRSWKGRTRLVAALLQQGTTERDSGERESHRGLTHQGYEDLSGQLRAALDQFSQVSLVNFTTVSVLTLVYLLLIGPGDFLLLSRLGLPRHVTWVTFPAVAVAVMALGGAMNRQAHGRRTRMNQVEIVDIDLASRRARGSVWCHLYSPKTRAYDATLQVSAPRGVAGEAIEGWLAWQGLPGDSMGGLESKQPTLVRREPYLCNAPGREPAMENLRVQVASSKGLGGRWWSKTELASEVRLSVDRYGLLAGQFEQPLAVGLNECLLAHGEKLYRLGTLAPGQRVAVADLAPLNLEARLTERRVENSKDVSTPWERDSMDIPRIVQMMMFHESARGRSYTGLMHRYQPEIDLSEHVRLGQAVLVGRGSEPVARLVGGESSESLAAPEDISTWTWYRIVLPVAGN